MKQNIKRVLALVLSVAMVMGLGVTGVRAVENETVLSYEKLDNSAVSAQLMQGGSEIEENENAAQYADTDMVRVTIVLEQAAAITKADSKVLTSAVSRERDQLKLAQEKMADTISAQVLGGQELDVVWNLTLVANAMSANVQYGQIEKIKAIEGVKSVFIETRYLPLEAESNNIVASQMTGANVLQDSGYTGAGSRIAVIDTGTDSDHQSFSNDGYLYSLGKLAEEKGMDAEEYIASLDLLDTEEIASVLDQLHVASRYPGITAGELYGGAKQPFSFNYIDNNLDTTHDNDDMGSHGSHVAGISAANRCIAVDKLYDFNADGVMDVLDAQALMDYAIAGTPISNTPSADLNDDGVVTDLDVHELLNIIDSGDVYVDAAGTVGVAGVAPDAQIITMKVFGTNGGAYSSDYMAAVEDAIVLGCDVANLSLGAANPGFTVAYEETEFTNQVMELVAEHDIIMAVAAGNNGNWADLDHAYQMMYADEAGTYTTSEPATYTNALSVASADNVGLVSNLKTEFNGSLELVFNPASGAETASWESLDANAVGTTYEAVFLGDPTGLITGAEQTDASIYAGSAADFEGCDFTGKVVLVSRGTYNFADKHMNAAAAGAAAVLIYNNVDGTINASIEGSTATVPCATIDLEDAKALYEMFTRNADGLYAGALTVTYGLNVNNGENVAYPTMSSFSSWGTTGSLTIKPEITAPGGGIYSVNGLDPSGAAYENMSGTSMATPHVAGLAALAAQYLQENGVTEGTPGYRVLTQSLMMSTATPLIEEETGLEYSVRNQGAGLANIENMVNAESYILVEGQPDGKVKAELGDGTEPKSFTFTVNNLTDTELVYDLSASMLTTATVTIDGYQLSADQMTGLAADVAFSTGDTVTVPAKGSAQVTVTITIPEETVAGMTQLGYVNGFYIEGYIYASPVTTDEGVVGVTHSIPLLGWYGNWTDPSMYDKGSFLEFLYEGVEYPPHMAYMEKNFLAWNIHGDTSGQYYTGNVYGMYDSSTGTVMGDSRYIEARNAVNSTENRSWDIFAIFPTLIRNAADFKVEVTDTDSGELYYVAEYEDYQLLASFYYQSYGQWYDTTLDAGVGPDGWDYTDANGTPLPEGTNFTVTLYTAPDYYVEDGQVRDWSELGEGIDLSFGFTVDNQAPQLTDVEDALVLRDNKLYFTVEDNNYVAAVVLLNGSGNMVMDYYYPDMDEEQKGLHTVGSIDISAYREYLGQKLMIAVCDYAGNESYYAINMGGEGAPYGDFVGFQYDPDGYANTWVSFSEGVNNTETSIFASDKGFVAAEYVNGLVFAQDDTGRLYGIPYEDMLANKVDLDETYITTLTNTYQDFAYNYFDGKLYGLLTYEYDGYPTSELHTINLRGEYYDSDQWMTVEAYQEDWAAQRGGVYGLAMAIDDAGSIYVLGPNYDWDTEALTETAHLWKASMEEDWWGLSLGAFTDIGDTGMEMDYLQSMTWNHNNEQLYWAQFYPASWLRTDTNLVKIDPETAQCEVVGELYGETCALFAPLTAETASQEAHQNVPEFDASVTAAPNMSVHNLTMGVGSTETISLTFDPWYSEDKAVVWTSSDKTVATVDENGVVTAVGSGACTITVTAANDEYLYDECQVTVASLTLNIEGILSHTAGGINSVYGSKLYDYAMIEGVGQLTLGDLITAPEEFSGFGLNIGSAVEARDSLWVSEFGNTGMIYQVNKDTGVIEDMLQPVDGDMMFGLSYSEKTDLFTGIMNYYLYVDLPMDHQMEEDILNSYDEEQHMYTYHKFDMSEYLAASDEGFHTGESGQGSIVDVVMAGITTIDNTAGTSYYAYMDYQGGYMGGEVSYTPATTHVILDNVGRLWYIDETVGMTLTTDEYGNTTYTKEDGSYIGVNFGGSFAQEFTDEEGNVTYNVFVIRKIEETPLTDQYRNGTMVRYTYHFSDIYYAGQTEDGAPMFFLSLYDYWNEGKTNQLYLYIPGVGTGEYTWDENWNRVEIKTPDSLYDLGTTGDGNIIATITSAGLVDGLPEAPEDTVAPIGTRRIYEGAYTK